MTKKIISSRHIESPERLFEARPFPVVFTQVAKHEIARANEQMNCEGIKFKEPCVNRFIHYTGQRVFPIGMDNETRGARGQRKWRHVLEFLPSGFAFLFRHASIENLWQSATPIKKLLSKSKRSQSPSQLEARIWSNPKNSSANSAKLKSGYLTNLA